MNFRAAITFLISLGSSSVPSFAEEFEMLSTSHFGYALERHSSTGFGQVGGSYLMFDLTTRSSNHLEFGLRSAAFGGQKHDVAFYRLGAGPLIGVKVRDNLQIQAAFLRFQESGHLKGHGHSYDSMGYLAQLGWQYCVPVFSRVTLAWGGFFSHHRGNIDQTDLGQQSAHTSLQNLNFNQGISQGIEIALRTEL